MPQPTATDVHVDSILTNVSIAYLQRQEHYVATQVFPTVPVPKQTDKYFTYTKADWFRDEAKIRGDAAESAGSGYDLSTSTYGCDVWAFHKDVGDKTRANADAPIDPDSDAARFVAQRLAIRQEAQFATDVFAGSIWDTDKTGTTDFTKWSDYTGSDPIEDIDAGTEQILSTTGYQPNTLLLGYKAWRKLKRHPDFRSQLNPTTAQNITPQILGDLLEIPRVLVAKAISNSSVEGNATQTLAFSLTTDRALLCYVNPQPSLLSPSAGYTFNWTGISQMGTPITTSRIRMEHLKADRIESEIAFDHKVVATDMGYMFLDAVD